VTSRYDDLSPRARWFLQNFDELDIADICANSEAAATKAQVTLERVRSECDRIEAAVRATPTSPDFDGAYLAAIGHIRAALQPPATQEPAETGEGQ
jgi:hypothetical protein